MINEGDQVFSKESLSGIIHTITNEGRFVVQWETGEISWNIEPRDVIKKGGF